MEKAEMKVIENGTITQVKGIKAMGISAGLKKSGKKDMAIIYSEEKAVSAGVFTKNLYNRPVLLRIYALLPLMLYNFRLLLHSGDRHH